MMISLAERWTEGWMGKRGPGSYTIQVHTRMQILPDILSAGNPACIELPCLTRLLQGGGDKELLALPHVHVNNTHSFYHTTLSSSHACTILFKLCFFPQLVLANTYLNINVLQSWLFLLLIGGSSFWIQSKLGGGGTDFFDIGLHNAILNSWVHVASPHKRSPPRKKNI